MKKIISAMFMAGLMLATIFGTMSVNASFGESQEMILLDFEIEKISDDNENIEVTITVTKSKSESTDFTDDPSSLSYTDWWSMFCHDPAHTGYSGSYTPDTNNILWSHKTDGYIESSPSIVDGKAYVGTSVFGGEIRGKFYCFDTSNGNILWVNSYIDQIKSSPAVIDKKVYVSTLNGGFLCLDANTGNEIWNIKLDSDIEIFSSPTVVDGKIYIDSRNQYDTSNNGKLYCLNAEDGSIIWYHETGNRIDYSPAVVDGKVYAVGLNNRLYCYNALNGNVIWKCQDIEISTHPAVADNKVYVGSSDGNIYCIENGEIIWKFQTMSYFISASPIVAYEKVYAGAGNPSVSEPDIIFCLDKETGKERWNYKGEDGRAEFWCIPSIADNRLFVTGRLYEEDSHAKVYCFNAFNGEIIWDYYLDKSCYNYVWGSVSIADGKLYVCSAESDVSGSIYCFGEGNPNVPPNKPTCRYDKTNDELVVSTTDPDGNQVKYGVSWDNDGNVDQWTELHNSGVEVRIDCGGRKGTVGVIAEDEYGAQSGWTSVKAKDIYDAVSDWSDPLSVSMPKNKDNNINNDEQQNDDILDLNPSNPSNPVGTPPSPDDSTRQSLFSRIVFRDRGSIRVDRFRGSTDESDNNPFSTILTKLFTPKTPTTTGSSLINAIFSKLLNLNLR